VFMGVRKLHLFEIQWYYNWLGTIGELDGREHILRDT
jgi:hypothetical protein